RDIDGEHHLSGVSGQALALSVESRQLQVIDGLIAGCRHKEETRRDGPGIPPGPSGETRGRAELPAVAPQGQVDLDLARCRHLEFRVSHRISSAVVSIDPIAPAG